MNVSRGDHLVRSSAGGYSSVENSFQPVKPSFSQSTSPINSWSERQPMPAPYKARDLPEKSIPYQREKPYDTSTQIRANQTDEYLIAQGSGYFFEECENTRTEGHTSEESGMAVAACEAKVWEVGFFAYTPMMIQVIRSFDRNVPFDY